MTTLAQLRTNKRINRYIAMRREKRHNERQHAKCIGYVALLIDRAERAERRV